MAEEKKPEKPAAEAPKKDPFVELVSIVGGGLLILLIVNGIFNSIAHSRLFSRGLRSFTPQSIVLAHTRPIVSLDHAVGVRVVSIDETPVYDSPGERKIGSQPFNARGKILQGPVIISSTHYWYVDYDKGVDGWVNESDIGYLESEPSFLERVLMGILSSVGLLKTISVLISLSAIFFMAYLVRHLTAIRRNQVKLLYPELPVLQKAVNPKWERVLAHIESQNEGDWKLAILEADIMLSSLLDTFSLPGDTMGEKLKMVEPSDFLTLQNAWEAHKIRNQVAHEGAEFLLSQREARRVIELYRTVFEEFQVI